MHSVENFPVEMWQNIAMFLDQPGRAALLGTCRHLKNIIHPVLYHSPQFQNTFRWALFSQANLPRQVIELNLSASACNASQSSYLPCVHPVTSILMSRVKFTSPSFSW